MPDQSNTVIDAETSVEEYLKTVYRPDCDYVDGVIEERNLGELDHAWIQSKLVAFFFARSRDTGLFAIAEWRFQIKPTRFRIPDLVVTRGKPGGADSHKSPASLHRDSISGRHDLATESAGPRLSRFRCSGGLGG